MGFGELPFSELIKRDRRLAELRQEYANGTAEERRNAAEWAYDESIAKRLFHPGVALAERESLVQEPWPEGIAALAIDRAYASAMLTGGSMEYQLGRRDEPTSLFHGLLNLPRALARQCEEHAIAAQLARAVGLAYGMSVADVDFREPSFAEPIRDLSPFKAAVVNTLLVRVEAAIFCVEVSNGEVPSRS